MRCFLYQGLTTVLWPQAMYEALSSLAGDAVATYTWLSSALRRTQDHDWCELSSSHSRLSMNSIGGAFFDINS